MLLVLNKADRFTRAERESLLQRLRSHTQGLLRADQVLAASALPAQRHVIRIDAQRTGVSRDQLHERLLPLRRHGHGRCSHHDRIQLNQCL